MVFASLVKALIYLPVVALAAPLPKSEVPAAISETRNAVPRSARSGHASQSVAERRPTAPTEPGELRAFYSANGLAQRGLNDLAVAEYRVFLSEHASHPESDEARFGMAVCLFRLHQPESAVEALRGISDPQEGGREADIGLLLGQCLLAMNEAGKAATAFETATSAARNDDQLDTSFAGAVEASFRSGAHTKALHLRDEFFTRRPNSPWRDRVEWFAALAAVQTDQLDLAQNRLRELIDAFPESALRCRAQLLLAQCLQRKGDRDAATAGFHKFLETCADDALVGEARLGLSVSLLQDGREADAAAALEPLLEGKGADQVARPVRFQHARIRFAQQRFEESLKEFASLAQGNDPVAADSAYWSAKCHLRMGHARIAADLFQQSAASADIIRPEAAYDRAVALSRSGGYPEAIEVLDSFLAAHADHALVADALGLRTWCEYQAGRLDVAAISARQLLDRFPRHARAGDMTLLAAEIASARGQFADAVDHFKAFLGHYPDSVQRMSVTLRLATSLFRLNDPDGARPLLQEVISEISNGALHTDAVLLLADIHLHAKEWMEAANLLDALVGADSQSTRKDEALLKLGLARARMGEHVIALRHFDRLLADFPQSPSCNHALFERAQCLAAREDWSAARAAFEELLARPASAFHTPARRQLAELTVQVGDYASAAGYFREAAGAAESATDRTELQLREADALLAAGEYARVEAMLSTAKQRDESVNQAPLLARLAIAQSRQDKHADAFTNAMLVSDEMLSRLDTPLRTAFLYERGWTLRKLNRNEESTVTFRRLAEEREAGDWANRAQWELATIDMEAGRWSEAYASLHILMNRLDPPTARHADRDDSVQTTTGPTSEVANDLRIRVTRQLGACAHRLQRYDEVVELLEPWLSPASAGEPLDSARFILGDSLLHLDRASAAQPHLERASQTRDPNLAGSVLLRLGECYAALQQWEKSEPVFAEFLARFPEREEWFQAQFGLGWAREHRAQYDQAIESYRVLIGRHRGVTAARAQFQVGECLFAKRDYEPAARELLKVDILYAYPEWSAAALYEAGRCLELLGKPADARRQFEAVSTRYPDTQWAKLAAERLMRRGADQHQTKG